MVVVVGTKLILGEQAAAVVPQAVFGFADSSGKRRWLNRFVGSRYLYLHECHLRRDDKQSATRMILSGFISVDYLILTDSMERIERSDTRRRMPSDLKPTVNPLDDVGFM
jgi:hypothetical protein